MKIPTGPAKSAHSPSTIWWSNGAFFISVHLAAVVGVYYRPIHAVPPATLILTYAMWQSAVFGITIGYHRLYSHRAFRANLWVKAIVAAFGASGFQGSIKWWYVPVSVLIDVASRHETTTGVFGTDYIMFTDDPIHDPYAATRGLFFSHMGWIFYKPVYERMELVDREDLDVDPVVRFQHNHYIPLAVFFGFMVPLLIGFLWADAAGAFIWGGFVARIAVWHCTFLVNSVAHWDGLQPYSDEDSSRGNLVVAILTGGEGNHNFHAFPHDFRSGPSTLSWDPSKWVILILHRLGLVTGLRRAREEDIQEASAFMSRKHEHGAYCDTEDDEKDWEGEVWDLKKVQKYRKGKTGRCVILVRGMVVDVTDYLGEHPGGAAFLRKYSFRSGEKGETGRDASWAFDGGLNQHSRAARKRMRELRIAKFESV